MTVLHKNKGKKGGRCNVTVCQKPEAWYFNKSTGVYYCENCATEINWPGGRADVMALYGVPLLCEKDSDSSIDAAEVRTVAAIYINEKTGTLLVKPVSEENQLVTTMMIQSADNSPAVLVNINATVSVRKIVEALRGLNDE